MFFKPYTGRAMYRPAIRLLLYMKLTVMLCIAVVLQTFASVKAQKITVNAQHETLKKVMKSIQKQQGYRFFFRGAEIANIPITARIQGASLEQAMNTIVTGKKLHWTLVDNMIVIRSEEEKTDSIKLEQIEIRGKVTDGDGKPLAGVTIREKNTKTISNSLQDGSYGIQVSGDNSILIFSSIGYTSQEISVGGQKILNIQLLPDNRTLEEVSVQVGFQNQRKVNLGGAISTLSAKDFENRPITNISQALKSTVPGLNVTIGNGGPQTFASYNIRGGTSISGSTVVNGSPLILVDGIEMENSNFSTLNPNDIENISVIKDASSSAIYGARAAFGVILVTTKKGRSGKPAINYSYDIQLNSPSSRPNFLDSYTAEYAQMKAGEYAGGGPLTEEQLEKLAAFKKYQADPRPENAWRYTPGSTTQIQWLGNYNPYDGMFKRYATTQKHNLSLRGGTETVKYYISFGFQDQSGIFKPREDNFKRYNGLVNLDIKLSERFNLGLNLNHNYTDYNEPASYSYAGAPWSVLLYQRQWHVNQPVQTSSNDPISNFPTNNIVSTFKYSNRVRHTLRNVGIYVLKPEFKVLPELKLKADISFRPSAYDYKDIQPQYAYINDNWSPTIASGTADGNISALKETVSLVTTNIYADYQKQYSKVHELNAVIGYNQESWKNKQISGSNSGIVSIGAPTLGNTYGENKVIGEQDLHWAVRGIFGRLNYIFKDRYIFELNGRYDGSSKFPKGRRYKFFPSYTVAWRLSEEPFMASTRKWLDQLKLRVNYGAIGNQNITNYAYYATLGSNLSGYMIDGQNAYQVDVPGLIDPNFTWETATSTNFGTDITLLRNRFNLSFDIYNRETKDIFLAGATYPAVLGTAAPQRNSGRLRSRGWELSLGWQDRIRNDFGYNIKFNIQDYQTKVISYFGNNTNSLSTLYSGATVGDIWGYETDRILQVGEVTNGIPNQYRQQDGVDGNGQPKFINKHRPNNSSSAYFPGDILYKDLNGDGSVTYGNNSLDDHGDLKIIGNSTPRLRWGLNIGADYRGLDITLFFDGVVKRDVWIDDNTWKGDINGLGNWDVYNNSWTPERPEATYPVYNSGRGQNWYAQTKYLFNGAFVRLNQAIIGYTLPKSVTRRVALSNVRVTLSGYNLFRLTNISAVYDPDLLGTNYPQIRSYALGVQVGF